MLPLRKAPSFPLPFLYCMGRSTPAQRAACPSALLAAPGACGGRWGTLGGDEVARAAGVALADLPPRCLRAALRAERGDLFCGFKLVAFSYPPPTLRLTGLFV